MTDKQLKDKAIDLKWKQYVLVSDRVLYFNEKYPNGCIKTFREFDTANNREIVKAVIIPDMENPDRCFTWYSQATWGEWFVNKTAALENAETSAVGRWLAFMWIGVIDSIASVDEMKKAGATELKKFTDTEYKKFEPVKWMYKTADEAIEAVKTKYVIDQIMEAKVRALYTN